MASDRFTDPESPSEQWVDVRMHDPAAGEWDVDAVVAAGQIEYLDLRIKPDLLPAFIECLLDDIDSADASRIRRRIAERNGFTLDDG